MEIKSTSWAHTMANRTTKILGVICDWRTWLRWQSNTHSSELIFCLLYFWSSSSWFWRIFHIKRETSEIAIQSMLIGTIGSKLSLMFEDIEIRFFNYFLHNISFTYGNCTSVPKVYFSFEKVAFGCRFNLNDASPSIYFYFLALSVSIWWALSYGSSIYLIGLKKLLITVVCWFV